VAWETDAAHFARVRGSHQKAGRRRPRRRQERIVTFGIRFSFACFLCGRVVILARRKPRHASG
jgi:hypothetical protein